MEPLQGKKPEKNPNRLADTRLDKKIIVIVFLLVVVVIVALGVYGSQLKNTLTTTPSAPGTLTVWYFYGNGCEHCTYVTPLVRSLQKKYPDVDFRILEIYDNPYNRDILISMNQKYHQKNSGIPVVFVGDTVLFGGDEIPQNLEKVIISRRQSS
jgi:hypothetical protein